METEIDIDTEPTSLLDADANAAAPEVSDPPAEPSKSSEGSSFEGIFADDKGAFVESWQEKLTGDEYADLRGVASNYKDLPTLLKSLKDNQAAARQRLEGYVKLPGEESSEEDVTAFRSALGVPNDAENYDLAVPPSAPDGFEFDEAITTQLKETAHQLNLTPDQLNGLVAFQVQSEVDALQEETNQQRQWAMDQRALLESEFGNGINEKLHMAARAAETFGLDPKNAIFAEADMVRAFAKIGESLSEDKLIASEAMDNRLSPESEADEIMFNENNPDHAPYRDAAHPRHKVVVEKVKDLMKQAYKG